MLFFFQIFHKMNKSEVNKTPVPLWASTQPRPAQCPSWSLPLFRPSCTIFPPLAWLIMWWPGRWWGTRSPCRGTLTLPPCKAQWDIDNAVVKKMCEVWTVWESEVDCRMSTAPFSFDQLDYKKWRSCTPFRCFEDCNNVPECHLPWHGPRPPGGLRGIRTQAFLSD